MDLQEVRESLERAVIKDGKGDGILLRPCTPHDFMELSTDLVMSAFDEIVKKIPQVQAGLDSFNNAEALAFKIICLHAERH